MTPDKLAEIKARHEADMQFVKRVKWVDPVHSCLQDRADLLAYVETLTKERDEAREAAEKYRAAYIGIAAPTYGHHVESLKKAERLPWEVKP